ncbi:hypothetical protein ABVT39_008032 [Epinephelus coioides]
MSELSEAMMKLQNVFDKYAGQDGDKKTLSKAELSNLLHKEFSVPKGTKSAELDTFFSALDNDNDGVVTFEEYVTFVAALATIQKEMR